MESCNPGTTAWTAPQHMAAHINFVKYFALLPRNNLTPICSMTYIRECMHGIKGRVCVG